MEGGQNFMGCRGQINDFFFHKIRIKNCVKIVRKYIFRGVLTNIGGGTDNIRGEGRCWENIGHYYLCDNYEFENA